MYPSHATVFRPKLSVTGRHPTLLRDRSFSDCLDTKMAFVNNQVISIVKPKPGISTPPPSLCFFSIDYDLLQCVCVYISCAYWEHSSLHLKTEEGKRDVLNYSTVALIHYAD